MAKLLTIGDSISQGFMSAAAARTDLSYSAILARVLGLTRGRDYHFPQWPLGGMPLNFEALLRHLERFFDNDIFGPFEWGAAIGSRIPSFLDMIENYYERGAGDYRIRYQDPFAGESQTVAGFHNLSAFGFTVADAWQVTPAVCLHQLEPNGVRVIDDEWFGTPSDAFYRNAFRVLNPNNDRARDDYSQLRWLEHYASEDPDGVENLVLWLGANNALGTVLHMELHRTLVDPDAYRRMTHFERASYNLWTREIFTLDYRHLISETKRILGDPGHTAKQPDWRVFLGTVPAVTVAPLAKGVGQPVVREDPFGVVRPSVRYYENYTYVVFDGDEARRGAVPHLSLDEAYEIDQHIAAFNAVIREEAVEANKQFGRERFVVVDINNALLRLAHKRNNGRPTYPLPPDLIRRGKPLINSRFYDAKGDRMRDGGLFSLDGVHPSAIGHGLLAREFLAAMRGVAAEAVDDDLDWDRIIATDDLFSRPVNLIREIYQHDTLLRLVVRSMRTMDESIDTFEKDLRR